MDNSDGCQEHLKTLCLRSKIYVSVFYDRIQPNHECMHRKRQTSFTNYLQIFILQPVVIQLDVQHELLYEGKSLSILFLLKEKVDNKFL